MEIRLESISDCVMGNKVHGLRDVTNVVSMASVTGERLPLMYSIVERTGFFLRTRFIQWVEKIEVKT